MNHNATLVRVQKPVRGLQVKTHVKAGSKGVQHNQTLVRPTSLKVKTHVKAGGIGENHNATLVRTQ